MCCWQMFVLKFSTTLTVHKSSSALSMLRTTARGEQEQPWGIATKRKASEEHPWKTQLFTVLAVPAGHGPAPQLPSPAPVPASPAASPQQRNILASPHCLMRTKTDFQLPFPLPKTNKLQCFKSEAFIRPCIPQAISYSSNLVCDLPKRHLVLNADCQELESLCTPLGSFKVNQHHCSPSVWFLIWIYYVSVSNWWFLLWFYFLDEITTWNKESFLWRGNTTTISSFFSAPFLICHST